MVRTVSVRALAAYRSSGADPPFGDPGRDHRAGLEGYYWRIVGEGRGLVLIVLCGVCRSAQRRWAVVALGSHPGGLVRHAVAEHARGDPERFGVRAEPLLEGSLGRLRLRLDADNWIDARLRPRVLRPGRAFGALGPAHLLPGLAQYWHPVLFDAEVEGEARVAGRALPLGGARAYAEKNWGPGFAGRWWWGHAGAFPEGDLGVAFAGGRLPLPGGAAAPTAVIVRHGERLLRLCPPLARARVSVGHGGWRIRLRSPAYRLELEGEPAGSAPHVLPVPETETRVLDWRSRQLLAGRLALRLRRGGRTVIDSVSPLAGLELGDPPGALPRPRPGEPPP